MMFKFSKHSGSVPLSRTTRLTLCRYAAPGNTGRFAVVPTGDLPVVGFNGQLELTATARYLLLHECESEPFSPRDFLASDHHHTGQTQNMDLERTSCIKLFCVPRMPVTWCPGGRRTNSMVDYTKTNEINSG